MFKRLLVRILLGKDEQFIAHMKIRGKTYDVHVTKWFDAAAWAKKAASALNLDDG